MDTLTYIHIHIYIYLSTYISILNKESAHAMLDAEKSQDLQSASWPLVTHGW